MGTNPSTAPNTVPKIKTHIKAWPEAMSTKSPNNVWTVMGALFSAMRCKLTSATNARNTRKINAFILRIMRLLSEIKPIPHHPIDGQCHAKCSRGILAPVQREDTTGRSDIPIRSLANCYPQAASTHQQFQNSQRCHKNRPNGEVEGVIRLDLCARRLAQQYRHK